jgi:penicillin-binding protein 2
LASSGQKRSPSRRFLPPDPRAETPYRVTTRIAVRLGIMGTLALVVFAVLFLRLWSLQILSGHQYLRAALNNQLRTIRTPAPRGVILDRHGRVLVENVQGRAVQVWPAYLPKNRAVRLRELRALSHVVNVPIGQIAAEIRKRRNDPLTPATIKYGIHPDQAVYLKEHSREFRGVELGESYLRSYPYRTLAAQVLGYVSEISKQQLKRAKRDGYRSGDKIGQSGIESAYDRYLRGRPGLAHLRVDSLGRPRSTFTPANAAQAGHAIRLTIDLRLQQAAERALRYGIEAARQDQQWAADGGAIVALDPHDGSILAMASNPTYDPRVYVGRVKPKALAAEGLTKGTAPSLNFPALNRAFGVSYPPGSSFKPVTALAAMQTRLISPYTSLECTGSYTVHGENGVDYTFNNWDPFVNQSMALPEALERSCDTYFYRVGKMFYDMPAEAGHPLQAWASRFGIGEPTGIDLGGESTGLLPTPEWRQATYTKKTDPCCWEVDRLWKPGDSIQLAIGQKDLLVTPLQMARFYAMIANGGRLVTPHLAQQIEQPGSNGSTSVVLRRFSPPPPLRTDVDPTALSFVREGLYLATHAPLGTGYGIFGSFPIPIAGKTGTAEKDVQLADGSRYRFDQSWWCGYGPANSPELVVCAVIENGGHGGTAAAPAALKVFEQFFGRQAATQGQVHSD